MSGEWQNPNSSSSLYSRPFAVEYSFYSSSPRAKPALTFADVRLPLPSGEPKWSSRAMEKIVALHTVLDPRITGDRMYQIR